MSIPKVPLLALEAIALDFDQDWPRLEGFPEGIAVNLLADDLDEATGQGSRTRIVRVARGVRTTHVLAHPYWEEVFLLKGDFTNIAEAAERTVRAPSYSRRPPGTAHGPFVTSEGCVLLEVQYFRR